MGCCQDETAPGFLVLLLASEFIKCEFKNCKEPVTISYLHFTLLGKGEETGLFLKAGLLSVL